MNRSVVVWIALSFGSRRCLDRAVVWMVPSFGSLRRLDRAVVWISLSFFGSLRRLDRVVVWIASSFGSLRRSFYRSFVWIAVIWIASLFGSLRRCLDRSVFRIAPLFASSRRLNGTIVLDRSERAALRYMHLRDPARILQTFEAFCPKVIITARRAPPRSASRKRVRTAHAARAHRNPIQQSARLRGSKESRARTPAGPL